MGICKMKVFVLCLLVAAAAAAPSRKPTFRKGLNKIVGGDEAAPGELPYQLSFQDISFGSPWHFCGASIYNENWGICAGHCVQGEDMNNPDYLQVVLVNMTRMLLKAMNRQSSCPKSSSMRTIIATLSPMTYLFSNSPVLCPSMTSFNPLLFPHQAMLPLVNVLSLVGVPHLREVTPQVSS